MTPEKLNDLRNELQAIIELAQAADWHRKQAGFCLDGQVPASALPGALRSVSDALTDIIIVVGRSLEIAQNNQ
jgi:hypothetical protein